MGDSWLYAELLQHHEDPAFYAALAHLFNAALLLGPPATWNHLTITSLHKKGSKQDPKNYRGISIMPILPKLYATIIRTRLEATADELQLQAPTQAGFKKDSRTEDNLLLLMTAIEQARHLDYKQYILFIDLEKAYDTVDRGLLWHTLLEELGLDPALVGSLQRLYGNLEAVLADHPELGPIPIT